MEARIIRISSLSLLFLLSMGASYRTANFVVTAPTDSFAKQVGDTAEEYRRELAIDWLGKEMPRWSRPCPITVQVGPQLGAGGATSFSFHHGEVFGWQMSIQGSAERILDSVLPHEVTHTIFACHFRQPLPRWADEGACTTVEHIEEKRKQQTMLIQFLKSRRGIGFDRMFAMKEYPQDVLPLYAQGYSLARFLIAQGGKRKFLAFVEDGLKDENWVQVTNDHYQFSDLSDLQTNWLNWVKEGSPLPIPGYQADPTPALLATNHQADSNIQVTSNIQSASSNANKKLYSNLVPIEPNSIAQSNSNTQSNSSMRNSVASNVSPNNISPNNVTPKNANSSTGSGWLPAGTRNIDPLFAKTNSDAYGAETSASSSMKTEASVASNDLPDTPVNVVSQAARAQPVQSAQQIILEWDRNSPKPSASTSSIPRPSAYMNRTPRSANAQSNPFPLRLDAPTGSNVIRR